jgi:DNA-binding NarL/FixJ family response regulator
MKPQSQPVKHVAPEVDGAKAEDISQVGPRMKSVLIGDPHPLVRFGMKRLLSEQVDLACCGEADSPASIRHAVQSLHPDILVLDLWLRGADGLELVKALRAEYPSLSILIFSQLDELLYAERALRAGAMGFISKEHSLEELVVAIRTVLGGDLFLSRKMSALLLKNSLQGKAMWGTSGVEMLTDRELQVFMLLGAGRSSRQVAASLQISLKTVETYRENIKHKLGFRDSSELTHSAALFVEGNSTQAFLKSAP